MKQNRIRLTESQLRNMIAEAINEEYDVLKSGMAGYINSDKDGHGDAVDASFRIGNNKPFSDSKLYRYSGKGKKNGNTFLNALKHNGGIKNFMKHSNRYLNADDMWTDNDAYGVNIYDGDYINESQLRRMVSEAVKKVLRESDESEEFLREKGLILVGQVSSDEFNSKIESGQIKVVNEVANGIYAFTFNGNWFFIDVYTGKYYKQPK